MFDTNTIQPHKVIQILLAASLLAGLAGVPTSATEISIVGNTGTGDESISSYVASVIPDREVHVIGVYEAGSNSLNIPPEIGNDPEAFEEWWLENVFRNHTTFPAQVNVNYDGTEPMEPITLVLSFLRTCRLGIQYRPRRTDRRNPTQWLPRTNGA